MPTYNDLRPDDDLQKQGFALVFPSMTTVEKKRTLTNLITLRAALDAKVVPRKTEGNLLIASWNIKEFGHTTQRLPEAYFYMAEIISRFDLVTVQEVKSTLNDLYILMRLLGDDWTYIVNDITEGRAGNSERSATLYNKTRVEFGGLAGEIVLWDDLTKNSAIKQLKRTPYITGFKAGWKRFAIVTLHLEPGESEASIEFRRQEVKLLLAAIAHKVESHALWNENLILAGDFNLYAGANKDGPTIDLINEAGYREVESLVGVDTNASHTESYDRLFFTDNDYFSVATNTQGVEVAGVFDVFQHVYRDGEEVTYAEFMKEDYTGSKDLNVPANLKSYFHHPWRKNQMSDHFPIWFELITDSADTFLEEIRAAYP